MEANKIKMNYGGPIYVTERQRINTMDKPAHVLTFGLLVYFLMATSIPPLGLEITCFLSLRVYTWIRASVLIMIISISM